jgi:hypothetical protein
MTEKENCPRHKNYLQGDSSIRRKMKFCSPGPLVQKDQEMLVNFILDLSKTYLGNKPKNLKSYEYDVLYPEVNKRVQSLFNSLFFFLQISYFKKFRQLFGL